MQRRVRGQTRIIIMANAARPDVCNLMLTRPVGLPQRESSHSMQGDLEGVYEGMGLGAPSHIQGVPDVARICWAVTNESSHSMQGVWKGCMRGGTGHPSHIQGHQHLGMTSFSHAKLFAMGRFDERGVYPFRYGERMSVARGASRTWVAWISVARGASCNTYMWMSVARGASCHGCGTTIGIFTTT